MFPTGLFLLFIIYFLSSSYLLQVGGQLEIFFCQSWEQFELKFYSWCRQIQRRHRGRHSRSCQRYEFGNYLIFRTSYKFASQQSLTGPHSFSLLYFLFQHHDVHSVFLSYCIIRSYCAIIRVCADQATTVFPEVDAIFQNMTIFMIIISRKNSCGFAAIQRFCSVLQTGWLRSPPQLFKRLLTQVFLLRCYYFLNWLLVCRTMLGHGSWFWLRLDVCFLYLSFFRLPFLYFFDGQTKMRRGKKDKKNSLWCKVL